MKSPLFILLGLFAGTLAAQTAINKTVSVQSGQKIRMNFDYPELIKVSTWDKNEISIQCSVSINNGENDDAYKLDITTEGNSISIRNEIKNMEDLPHRITVIRDGEKTVFRNRAEWRKYQAENALKYAADGISACHSVTEYCWCLTYPPVPAVLSFSKSVIC